MCAHTNRLLRSYFVQIERFVKLKEIAMSNLALDLMIDSGLIDNKGRIANLDKLSDNDVSIAISQYINGRRETIHREIEEYEAKSSLSALYSSCSVDITNEKILSSALVYESIVVNDPLVTSQETVDVRSINNCLDLFSTMFELIRAGIVLILPLQYLNKPSDDIPLLYSDDAFRSDIPQHIYDFVHENAVVNSVVRDEKGRMLVLNGNAYEKRHSALNVSFKNDYWINGVSGYLFQTIESHEKTEEGNLNCKAVWDPKMILSEDKFNQWANQSINQAMRSRLAQIYNETYVAEQIGHTYITESSFESKMLGMSGDSSPNMPTDAVRFLNANQTFLRLERPETILELRAKHSLAFKQFNATLISISEELSDIDPDLFDKKAQALYSKEIYPQVEEIRKNVNLIQTGSATGFLTGVSGLVAAIAMSKALPIIPALMLPTLIGALPGLNNRRLLNKKPGYIWHRMSH